MDTTRISTNAMFGGVGTTHMGLPTSSMSQNARQSAFVSL